METPVYLGGTHFFECVKSPVISYLNSILFFRSRKGFSFKFHLVFFVKVDIYLDRNILGKKWTKSIFFITRWLGLRYVKERQKHLSDNWIHLIDFTALVPTDPFGILKLLDTSIDLSVLLKIRRSTDFEALKL